MISLALMGIIAMLFSSLFQDMIFGQNTGRFLSAITTFHEELQADLSSKTACFNSMQSLTIEAKASLPLTEIKDASNKTLYSVGSAYGDGTFTIKTITLKVDDDYTGVSGEGTLYVGYQAVPKVTGPLYRVRNFKVELERDGGTHKLTECIGKAKMTDGIWRRESSTVNNIYFSDGSVAIGMTSPTEKLQVDGNVLLGSQTTRATGGDRGQLAISSTFTKTSAGSTTLDWDNGNIQEISTFLCNGTNVITMSNIHDGGAYSLLLSGTAAHSGKCLFSSAGYSFVASGGNIAPVASQNVLFTFAVINKTVVFSMTDNLIP